MQCQQCSVNSVNNVKSVNSVISANSANSVNSTVHSVVLPPSLKIFFFVSDDVVLGFVEDVVSHEG